MLGEAKTLRPKPRWCNRHILAANLCLESVEYDYYRQGSYHYYCGVFTVSAVGIIDTITVKNKTVTQ